MAKSTYPTIYVDPHEKNSMVLYFLDKFVLDWEFLKKENPVGDYFISNIVIELKSSMSDLVASIEDSRANNQVFNLSANLDNSYLVIIGNINDYLKDHQFKIEPIIAQLTSLSMRRSSKGKMGHINVIFLYSEYEFVLWLKHIQKRAHDKTPRVPIAPKLRKFTKDPEYAIPFTIQQTPDIGADLTRSLLSHFGSIEKVVNASVKELMEVPKIGKVRAQKAYNFYRTDWRDFHYEAKPIENLFDLV